MDGITRIAHLLSDDDLAAVLALLNNASFVSGKDSAEDSARVGKKNLEADLSDDARRQIDNIVMRRLTTHPEYVRAALPVRAARPLYAKYTSGMEYAAHFDNPLMGAPPNRYRSDLAVTIFLSAPQAYDGGELIINANSAAAVSIKYSAGDAVLYPASTIHRVAPVTRGERLVALTWVQSLVRDVAQRELLRALQTVRDGLAARAPNTPEQQHIEWVYGNLIRRWGET